jgi:Bacteriophage Mu, Gp27
MKKKKDAKKLEPAHPSRVPFRGVPAKTWKIKRMPKDLKKELDALMRDGAHTSNQLAKWLRDNGFEISSRSLRQYREDFEQRLDSVRLATEQARIVCEQFKDDDPNMQTALMRLVQTQLFQVLAASNGEDATKVRPEIAPINIGALARCVSNLIKAESDHQKWADRARARVATAEKKVEEATTKGLSKTAAQQIKAVLMEI